VLRELRIGGYGGWLVVEAEQDPAKAHPLTYAKLGYRNLNDAAERAGFPWMFGRSHAPAAEKSMLAFCLVGGGFIGPLHAANIAAHRRARLAWVVDLDSWRRRRSSRPNMGARASANLDDALAEPAVGAVMICTPPRTHAAIIERAAHAGKAIFCEKPVDLDIARVDACARRWPHPASVLSSRSIAVSTRRTGALAMRSAPERSAAGDARAVEPRPRRSRPRLCRAMPYGIFYDTMIHDFDMVRWLLADETGRSLRPDRVHARREREPASRPRHRDGDADDDQRRALVHVQLELSCGVRLRSADRSVRREGNARVAQPAAHEPSSATTRRVSGATRLLRFFIERYAASYARELDEFIRRDRGERAPPIAHRRRRRALLIADAGRRSRRNPGKRSRFPLGARAAREFVVQRLAAWIGAQRRIRSIRTSCIVSGGSI
jgi:myo-inositol 2-dehydrogenase/D-chiro-inositol 1-dehydrogenase